jgi:hypothetical protein
MTVLRKVSTRNKLLKVLAEHIDDERETELFLNDNQALLETDVQTFAGVALSLVESHSGILSTEKNLHAVSEVVVATVDTEYLTYRT